MIRDWGSRSSPGWPDYGRGLQGSKLLIYLVRHGHSQNLPPAEDDPTKANASLTPLGEAQARLVGRRLRALEVDRLVSSPMVRAIETARIVGAEVGLSVEVWRRCHEYRTAQSDPCWGGRELRASFSDLILPADFPEDDWAYGGEPLLACVERADEFLRWLDVEAVRSTASRMAIITHSAFPRIVLGRIFHVEPALFRRVAIADASITTLELSAIGFRLLGLNDTCHLS